MGTEGTGPNKGSTGKLLLGRIAVACMHTMRGVRNPRVRFTFLLQVLEFALACVQAGRRLTEPDFSGAESACMHHKLVCSAAVVPVPADKPTLLAGLRLLRPGLASSGLAELAGRCTELEREE